MVSIETLLNERSGGCCELCGGKDDLMAVEVPPSGGGVDGVVHCCSVCRAQMEGDAEIDANHWRCLNESAWSEVSAVQVLSYRLLHKMGDESWARDLLDMLYLDDETLEWAQQGLSSASEDAVVHKDSNGAVLSEGDTVTLIKDLNVKGGGFTAKRGTNVRSIRLVASDAGQIEGRVNGQAIVILTQFVKKVNS